MGDVSQVMPDRLAAGWRQPPVPGFVHVGDKLSIGKLSTSCYYVQDDVLVRALRFLDNLLQRDNLQKAAFLKDAQKFWPRLDMRVLRYAVSGTFAGCRLVAHKLPQDARFSRSHLGMSPCNTAGLSRMTCCHGKRMPALPLPVLSQVLPPLLTELRNEALQALVLPLVLGIIPQQDEADFMDWTLPSLLPIATSAKVWQYALLQGCMKCSSRQITTRQLERSGAHSIYTCRRWAGSQAQQRNLTDAVFLLASSRARRCWCSPATLHCWRPPCRRKQSRNSLCRCLCALPTRVGTAIRL